MTKGTKFIAGGAAALLLGATGLMAGCEEGADDPDIGPPPAMEDQNGVDQPAPADEPAADDSPALPALPDPEEGGNDDGGGLDY